MEEIFTNIPILTNHKVHIYDPGQDEELPNRKNRIMSRIIILLHGYKLDGKFIYDKFRASDALGSSLENSILIAPNGPFMVPVAKKNEFIPTYAWYFFDPFKKEYYVNLGPSADYIQSIMTRLYEKNPAYQELPITVIGYSQGGYLAPKIAEIIPNVDQVIGLACVFRNNQFSFNQKTQYHQIHSDSDLVVNQDGALDEFKVLKERGNIGRFIEIKGTSHRLNDDYLEALKSVLPVSN